MYKEWTEQTIFPKPKIFITITKDIGSQYYWLGHMTHIRGRERKRVAINKQRKLLIMTIVGVGVTGAEEGQTS